MSVHWDQIKTILQMKNNQNVVVLGHKGMLGQTACQYFTKKGFNIITNSERFTPETRADYREFILKYDDAIIINCIGKIKQKTDDLNELLWSNSILPLELANILNPSQLLIHPSTDCVFQGNKLAPYLVEDIANAIDDYGWSKRLAEVALLNKPNVIIIRVSIIGKDACKNPKGLLGWFLHNKEGAKLQGYANHLWNGITTLEWCKQAHLLIDDHRNGNMSRPEIIQLGTEEFYSKHQMLELFQKTFQTKYEINAFETPIAIDRRLKPNIVCKNLTEQLQELL